MCIVKKRCKDNEIIRYLIHKKCKINDIFLQFTEKL